MVFVSLALGLLIAVLGTLAVASPASFAALLREVQSPAGLYSGAAFRVILGISLLVSARGSRAPVTLRVLGVLFLAVGLVMPLRGLDPFRANLELFLSLGDGASRVWGIVALGLGLSLAYAVVPRTRAAFYEGGPVKPSSD